MDFVVNGGLTKRQIGILRSANRGCGMSYRSACNRGIKNVKELQNMGLLSLIDTKRDLSRFKFKTTPEGKEALEAIS